MLGAAYLLWLYQRVFWGKVTHEENKSLVDLNAREIATLVPLVVLCFWIGVYPKPFLEFLHKPGGPRRGDRPAREVRPPHGPRGLAGRDLGAGADGARAGPLTPVRIDDLDGHPGMS